MNTILKLALLQAGKPAYLVAQEADMNETRLSRIVQGRLKATLKEQRALSRLLGVPVDRLFQGPFALSPRG